MMDPMAGGDPKERLLRLLEMAYEQYAMTPPMPMPDVMAGPDPMAAPPLGPPVGPEESPEGKGMLRDKLSADVAKKAPKDKPKEDKPKADKKPAKDKKPVGGIVDPFAS